MSDLGSKHVGIERSSRRVRGYRPSGRDGQASAPEFPRSITEPAGFRFQHDVSQAIGSERGFQTADVLEESQVHGLRNNARLGPGLRADRLPPKKLALEF